MQHEFNLETYLTGGVEKIIKGAIKATFRDPKESVFLSKFAISSKAAAKLRRSAEEKGEHIPPFLIASITSQCNLHCAGCYARTNQSCGEEEDSNDLTGQEWTGIFRQAKDMGIGFILLAGGEPLIRKDVIQGAGEISDIMFPVFTNGTLMDENYINLFDKYRNLVCVFSMEGHESKTDERRGTGVYESLTKAMDLMKARNLLFGVSVTLTKNNLEEVTSRDFLNHLAELGCKVVFFVEYVPVTLESKVLAPGDLERDIFNKKLVKLREEIDSMIFISFPGDEKTSGGCLAAGRGFFHINAHGGAEPCPFSPYSDCNVRDSSLKDALNSPLFLKLQNQNILMEEHEGGCVLFERREIVEGLLDNNSVNKMS